MDYWLHSSIHFAHPGIDHSWLQYHLIFSSSFLFTKLTIVLSDFPSLWQAVIWNLISIIPISSNACMPKLSNSFGGSAFGIPEKSKHSLLEYCSSWCWFLSSSTILFFVFWNASCKTFDVFSEMRISFDNFSFCFTKRSNLEVISSSFWFISLFCSRRSWCYTRMFSCNAKNDEMMFLLLIFFQLSSGKNFRCHDCAMITPPWLQ